MLVHALGYMLSRRLQALAEVDNICYNNGAERQIKYFWIFLRPQIMGVIKIVTELIRKDFAKYMTTIFKIPQNLLVELEACCRDLKF